MVIVLETTLYDFQAQLKNYWNIVALQCCVSFWYTAK